MWIYVLGRFPGRQTLVYTSFLASARGVPSLILLAHTDTTCVLRRIRLVTSKVSTGELLDDGDIDTPLPLFTPCHLATYSWARTILGLEDTSPFSSELEEATNPH